MASAETLARLRAEIAAIEGRPVGGAASARAGRSAWQREPSRSRAARPADGAMHREAAASRDGSSAARADGPPPRGEGARPAPSGDTSRSGSVRAAVPAEAPAGPRAPSTPPFADTAGAVHPPSGAGGGVPPGPGTAAPVSSKEKADAGALLRADGPAVPRRAPPPSATPEPDAGGASAIPSRPASGGDVRGRDDGPLFSAATGDGTATALPPPEPRGGKGPSSAPPLSGAGIPAEGAGKAERSWPGPRGPSRAGPGGETAPPGPPCADAGVKAATASSTGSTGANEGGATVPAPHGAEGARPGTAMRRAVGNGPSTAPCHAGPVAEGCLAEAPRAEGTGPSYPKDPATAGADGTGGDRSREAEAEGRQAAGVRGEPHAAREAGADGDGFFGLSALDRLFPGGFPAASLHEVAVDAARDGGLSTGFSLALVRRWLEGAAGPGAVLWVSERLAASESGAIHGPGCLALGLDPGRLVLVVAHGARDVLWAMEEGLSAGGTAAVVGEVRGEPRVLDLTASRRLALRSERHGVPALLLRNAGGAGASAARTRWRIAPAPGRGTAPPVPGAPDAVFAGGACGAGGAGGLPPMGLPVWRVDLVRNREGRCGGTLAGFDPARGRFFVPAVRHARRVPSIGGPAGAVLPFPALRSAGWAR